MMEFDVLFTADPGVAFMFVHTLSANNLANICYRFAIDFIQILNRFQQFQQTRNLKKKKIKLKEKKRVAGQGTTISTASGPARFSMAGSPGAVSTRSMTASDTGWSRRAPALTVTTQVSRCRNQVLFGC